MGTVKTAAFSMSLDGYGAGPRQDLQPPLGVQGQELFQWLFQTEFFKAMYGQPGGAKSIDNDMARRSFENVGAWIMGRNMFGPVRGPWQDDRLEASQRSRPRERCADWRRRVCCSPVLSRRGHR